MFYPASPVRLRRMSGATSRAAGQIAMVGLFVDADDKHYRRRLVAAAERAAAARFGIAPNAWPSARGLASRCGKALSPPAMSHAPQPCRGAADLILFDAKTPSACAARRHGVGPITTRRPDIAVPCRGLAGGLNPTNVAEAIARSWSAAGRYLQRRRKRARITGL